MDVLDGYFQYFSGAYAAAFEAMQEVMRISPGRALDTFYACRWTALSLGQLGRAEEAKEWLDKAVAISPESAGRIVRQRPPWMRPRDHAHAVEGMRKAGWQMGPSN
jgi:adenylate cyclase